jgi:hypothetical protein
MNSHLPELNKRTLLILRCNGNHETFKLSRNWSDQIRKLINAKALDFVSIGRGSGSDLIMAVDDFGYETEAIDHGIIDGTAVTELRPVKALKPINPEATKLYHQVCKPNTTHQIVGDVAILHDNDA